MLPDQETIRALLAKARTIAVIGAKDTPGQPVDGVGRYLIRAGYDVIPVHPKRKNVWGLTTYASITDVPTPVDIVNLFRAAEYCPAHAREVLSMARKPLAFWMQIGITSPEATALLEPEHIIVIQDKCLKVEHMRLLS